MTPGTREKVFSSKMDSNLREDMHSINIFVMMVLCSLRIGLNSLAICICNLICMILRWIHAWKKRFLLHLLFFSGSNQTPQVEFAKKIRISLLNFKI